MFVLPTVVLVILSLIISSSTSLKFFTNVVRHPGLKSVSESNSPTSTESKLSCELRSSSYNARSSSCASLISFFSYNKNKNNSHFSNINNYLAFLYVPLALSVITINPISCFCYVNLCSWFNCWQISNLCVCYLKFYGMFVYVLLKVMTKKEIYFS